MFRNWSLKQDLMWKRHKISGKIIVTSTTHQQPWRLCAFESTQFTASWIKGTQSPLCWTICDCSVSRFLSILPEASYCSLSTITHILCLSFEISSTYCNPIGYCTFGKSVIRRSLEFQLVYI